MSLGRGGGTTKYSQRASTIRGLAQTDRFILSKTLLYFARYRAPGVLSAAVPSISVVRDTLHPPLPPLHTLRIQNHWRQIK